MSFMSGFFEDDFALPPNIRNLGVRAFTSDGDELMYVLSSRETARCCGRGQAIEWLKNSLFQDNTPENRAARANTLIARIETGLRAAVARRLEQSCGTGWWAAAVPKLIKDEVAQTSRKTLGGTASGAQLIEYTYLRHLKDIVLQNWRRFVADFADASKFGRTMDELNGIRRDESHNRPISDVQMATLEGLYSYLAGAVAGVDPNAVPGYLVENWRGRLGAIVRETSDAMPDISDKDRQDPGLVGEKFDGYAAALSDGLGRLKTIVVPPGKEALHSELLDHWTALYDALDDMRVAADSGDTQRLSAAAGRHERELGHLRSYAATYLLSELGH
jgi:hypothetical protein